MTTTARIGWWVAVLAAALLLLWVLGNAIAPFLAGAVLAYFLDPVVEWLERRGIGRGYGAMLVIVLAFGTAVAAFLLLIPVLVTQTLGLLDALPVLVARFRDWLAGLAVSDLGGLLDQDVVGRIGESIRSAGTTLGTGALKAAISGGVAFIDAAAFAIVVPVVGYYLLADWKEIVEAVERLVPRGIHATVLQLAGAIHTRLAAFLRGQVLVCAALAVFYAIALTVAGLDYGASIGIVAGLASFIPYVGTVIGFALSIGFALVQFLPEWIPVLLVAGVFLIGQLAESYVLTPRLVGRRIGLHPVWLLFALVAGGQLFGFAGLLVAVPLAAAAGVLVRFGCEQYLKGRFYLGSGDED